MKKKLMVLALTAIFLCGKHAFAQDDSNAIGVSFAQTAKVWSPYTVHIHGQAQSLALHYLINMKNNKSDWARWVDYIDLEASGTSLRQVHYANAANNGTFGNIYAFVASAEIPLPFTKVGPAELYVSPGVGPAWTPNDFYNTKNRNYAFGRHLNMESKVDVELMVGLFAGVFIKGAIGWHHFSDSDTEQPNCGFNEVPFSFSVIKNLNVSGPENQEEMFSMDRKNLFNVQLIYGSEGPAVTGLYKMPNGTNKYADTVAVQRKTSGLPQASLSFNYERRIVPVFALTCGIDGIWSFRKFDWNRFFYSYDSNYAAYSQITAGGTIGGEVWLGNMIFSASYERYFIGNFVYGGNHPSGVICSARYHFSRAFAIEGKAYLSRFAGAGVVINPF